MIVNRPPIRPPRKLAPGELPSYMKPLRTSEVTTARSTASKWSKTRSETSYSAKSVNW